MLNFGLQDHELLQQWLHGLREGFEGGLFAQGFHLHHPIGQAVHTKQRSEALELVQQIVQPLDIACGQALAQLGKIRIQCVFEGVQQSVDT